MQSRQKHTLVCPIALMWDTIMSTFPYVSMGANDIPHHILYRIMQQVKSISSVPILAGSLGEFCYSLVGFEFLAKHVHNSLSFAATRNFVHSLERSETISMYWRKPYLNSPLALWVPHTENLEA
jgi:hypothetical protein